MEIKVHRRKDGGGKILPDSDSEIATMTTISQSNRSSATSYNTMTTDVVMK